MRRRRRRSRGRRRRRRKPVEIDAITRLHKAAFEPSVRAPKLGDGARHVHKP